MVDPPAVELLWWEGCPSTEPARRLLREALDEHGLGSVAIRMTEIATDEQARERGFRGSPTILLDGADLVELAGAEDPEAEAQAAPALSCRLYRRRDGRISPTPDPADVGAALDRLLGVRAVTRRAG